MSWVLKGCKRHLREKGFWPIRNRRLSPRICQPESLKLARPEEASSHCPALTDAMARTAEQAMAAYAVHACIGTGVRSRCARFPPRHATFVCFFPPQISRPADASFLHIPRLRRRTAACTTARAVLTPCGAC